MSRSYKKNPGYMDRNPHGKNQANRKVRHTQDISNGKAYKKLYESYGICDFGCLWYSTRTAVKISYHQWKYDYAPKVSWDDAPWRYTRK